MMSPLLYPIVRLFSYSEQYNSGAIVDLYAMQRHYVYGPVLNLSQNCE